MLIDLTKGSIDLLHKMTPKAFVVPYLLSTFKNLFLSCSKCQLSRPLTEKLKIGVNFNSINNLDVSDVRVRRQLIQVSFGLQTKSVQTQTDMINKVTIERFTIILNDENC